jgi:hypothetical protein
MREIYAMVGFFVLVGLLILRIVEEQRRDPERIHNESSPEAGSGGIMLSRDAGLAKLRRSSSRGSSV